MVYLVTLTYITVTATMRDRKGRRECKEGENNKIKSNQRKEEMREVEAGRERERKRRREKYEWLGSIMVIAPV